MRRSTTEAPFWMRTRSRPSRLVAWFGSGGHLRGRIGQEMALDGVPGQDLALLVPCENASAVGAERHAAHPLMCPLRAKSSWPLSASHTFAVLSRLPVRMRRPSGLNATLVTQSVCPLRAKSSWPLAASHTFAVLSWLPVRMRRPSGLNATLVHRPVCPTKVALLLKRVHR